MAAKRSRKLTAAQADDLAAQLPPEILERGGWPVQLPQTAAAAVPVLEDAARRAETSATDEAATGGGEG